MKSPGWVGMMLPTNCIRGRVTIQRRDIRLLARAADPTGGTPILAWNRLRKDIGLPQSFQHHAVYGHQHHQLELLYD